jgi:hypothetical protein
MERRTKLVFEDEFLENDPELQSLARMISAVPDEEPPRGLPGAVMARIRSAKRRTLLQRFLDWTTRPVAVRITPARFAPVLAVLLLAMLLLPRLFSPPAGPGPLGTEGEVRVVFTLSQEHARTVAVVGSFNGWDPAGYDLHQSGGKWILKTTLPAGRHEYAFLIDGRLIVSDPGVAFTTDDGFGNRNSVLILGNDDSTA